MDRYIRAVSQYQRSTGEVTSLFNFWFLSSFANSKRKLLRKILTSCLSDNAIPHYTVRLHCRAVRKFSFNSNQQGYFFLMAQLSKRWAPTRVCGCPDDSEKGSDCRFKPASYVCPNANLPGARKLWSVQFVDLDTGEIVLPGEADEIIDNTNPLPEEVVAEILS